MKTKRFDILTIFPHIFDSYLGESLFKRAIHKKIISITVHDLRAFAQGKHKKVDDRPFGGGPGMVLQLEPIYRAVTRLQTRSSKKTRTILFSTRGAVFNAATAQRLAKYDRLILICGRYEGVDERVAQHIADEEISLGSYVLSGGELPALIVTEAVSRFLPGFLGKTESLEEKKGSYPVYSRPVDFLPSLRRGKKSAKWSVPTELLSGNHAKIKAWRQRQL